MPTDNARVLELQEMVKIAYATTAEARMMRTIKDQPTNWQNSLSDVLEKLQEMGGSVDSLHQSIWQAVREAIGAE